MRFLPLLIATALLAAANACTDPGSSMLEPTDSASPTEGAFSASPALAQSGVPFGQTGVAVGFDYPPDGVLLAGSVADPLALSGEASVGAGMQTVIYVLEISYRLELYLGMYDALADLNQAVIASGAVDEVAMIGWNEGALLADVSPEPGRQTFTGPATDANGSGIPDIEEVMRSVFVDPPPGGTPCLPGDEDHPDDCPPPSDEGEPGFAGFSDFSLSAAIPEITNAERAVRLACELAQEASNPNVTVIFVLANSANDGGFAPVPCSPVSARFITVSPPWRDCETNFRFGTLKEMAHVTGGECVKVPSLEALGETLVALAPAPPTFQGIDIVIDDSDPEPASLDPSAPFSGPGETSWVFDASPPPGHWDVCAYAQASWRLGTAPPEIAQACVGFTIAEMFLEERLFPADLAQETLVSIEGLVGHVSSQGIEFTLADVPVRFTVLDGPNQGTEGEVVSGSSGFVEFELSNPNQNVDGLGTDEVEACFTDDLDNDECARIEVEWANLSPPAAACTVVRRPDGEPVQPREEGGVRGLLQLSAEDVIDPDPDVFVRDTGTGEVFGPFADGAVVRYTRAPGRAPDERDLDESRLDVVAHLMGSGEPEVFARDFSGNESDPVVCSGGESS